MSSRLVKLIITSPDSTFRPDRWQTKRDSIFSFSWFSEWKVWIVISRIKFMTDNYVFFVRCDPKFYVLFMRKSAGTCRAMVLAVIHRPLTTETRVRSQFSPCEIFGGKSGPGWGFSPSTAVFLVSLSFHQCPTFISIYSLLLPEEQTSEAWEPSKKQFSSGNRGDWDRNVPSLIRLLSFQMCRKW